MDLHDLVELKELFIMLLEVLVGCLKLSFQLSPLTMSVIKSHVEFSTKIQQVN